MIEENDEIFQENWYHDWNSNRIPPRLRVTVVMDLEDYVGPISNSKPLRVASLIVESGTSQTGIV
jgi:hypothetical protein